MKNYADYENVGKYTQCVQQLATNNGFMVINNKTIMIKKKREKFDQNYKVELIVIVFVTFCAANLIVHCIIC